MLLEGKGTRQATWAAGHSGAVAVFSGAENSTPKPQPQALLRDMLAFGDAALIWVLEKGQRACQRASLLACWRAAGLLGLGLEGLL